MKGPRSIETSAERGAQRHGACGFSLVELLVSIGVIGLLIAIMLPALARTRTAGGEAVSLSRVNQCALAIHQYSQWYKDSYPWAPEGTLFLLSPPEDPNAWIQGDYWLLAACWPSLMHDVAPWPEHFASWIGPGAETSGAPWLRPGKQGQPSYELSHTFIARPDLWNPAVQYDPALMLRPVRAGDIRYPSSKVLLIDADVLHIKGAPITLATSRPLAFADSHASVRRLLDATPPPLLGHKPDTRPCYDTPGGVYGADFP